MKLHNMPHDVFSAASRFFHLDFWRVWQSAKHLLSLYLEKLLVNQLLATSRLTTVWWVLTTLVLMAYMEPANVLGISQLA